MGNWVVRFTTDSVLKGIALVFKNCDEYEVRGKMANQFKGYWSSICTLEDFEKSKYRSNYNLIEVTL